VNGQSLDAGILQPQGSFHTGLSDSVQPRRVFAVTGSYRFNNFGSHLLHFGQIFNKAAPRRDE
jgi:hypothetical protein